MAKPEALPVCFVVGPIGAPGSDARKRADMLFNAVVKPVVEGKYQLLRVDKEQKPGMITDAIIQRVVESPLVIADLTSQNPNVFYELGIRHASGKATIHMSADGPPLPFDNAGHSTIFLKLDDWDSIEIARHDLSDQVAQTISSDFKPSNPVTQAITMLEFATSSDSEERSIALLSQRIENLELELKRRTSAGGIGRSSEAASTRLMASISNIESRKKELSQVANILAENARKELDATQVRNWIDVVAADSDAYKDVLAKIDSGSLHSILNEIEDQVPF